MKLLRYTFSFSAADISHLSPTNFYPIVYSISKETFFFHEYKKKKPFSSEI